MLKIPNFKRDVNSYLSSLLMDIYLAKLAFGGMGKPWHVIPPGKAVVCAARNFQNYAQHERTPLFSVVHLRS